MNAEESTECNERSSFHIRHVKQLSLQGCRLSSLGLQNVSDALCSVVHTSSVCKLNLSGNHEVRTSIAFNYALLLITSLQFGVVGAKYLGNVLENNKVLQHLLLNNCSLGDDGLQPVAKGKRTVNK